MLRISEFTVGTLSDAQPLSLILPRGRYEQTILVGSCNTIRRAVFLDPSSKWASFEYEENSSYGGVLVPNVEIEVDVESALNASRHDMPLGTLVRAERSLFVTVSEGDGFRGGFRGEILTNLSEIPERQASGFLRWQITLSAGEDKRVLKAIDIQRPEGF